MRSDKAVRALKKVPYPVLECVLNLLKDEGRWTQRSEARGLRKSIFGSYEIVAALDPNDPNATQFCLIGAVRKCDKNADKYLRDSEGFYHDFVFNVTSFNDDDYTTHDRVVWVIQKAMKEKLGEKINA